MHTLFCDGASRGNPGNAAWGYVLLENDHIVSEGCSAIGINTNNVAEYLSLIEGLKKCQELKISTLTVKMDSELVVKQVRGEYKVKAQHLLPFYTEVKKLLKGFVKYEVIHIPREQNKLADTLANQALDSM